jgi:hypothetical protein
MGTRSRSRTATAFVVAALALGGTAARAQPEGHDGAGPAGAAMGATHGALLDPAAAEAQARNWQMRTGELIKRTWGVEVLGVRLASSKWMLSFRYRVVDPEKAKVLLDPKSTAYLVDEASGARLAVPAMENIGDLRQSTQARPGREYYIMFGNGNQVVHPGGRVDVVIGAFHADGLIVQ